MCSTMRKTPACKRTKPMMGTPREFGQLAVTYIHIHMWRECSVLLPPSRSSVQTLFKHSSSSGHVFADLSVAVIQVYPLEAAAGDSASRGFVSATLNAEGQFQLTPDLAQAVRVRALGLTTSILQLHASATALTTSFRALTETRPWPRAISMRSYPATKRIQGLPAMLLTCRRCCLRVDKISRVTTTTLPEFCDMWDRAQYSLVNNVWLRAGHPPISKWQLRPDMHQYAATAAD